MGPKVKGRKAWLVTWDWTGAHAAVPQAEVIAAILHPQTGSETVRRLVELLYAAREYTDVDKLDALRRNPYPAQFGTIPVAARGGGTARVPYLGHIHCGHNPFLFARVVASLRLKDSGEPDHGLEWEELPLPDMSHLGEV